MVSGDTMTSTMASSVGGAPGAAARMSSVTLSAAPGPNMAAPSAAMAAYSATAAPKHSASRRPQRCGWAMEE